MNAAGLIILALGIILIIIGVKGSQHTVIQSLKGVGSNPASAKKAGPVIKPTPGQSPVGSVA